MVHNIITWNKKKHKQGKSRADFVAYHRRRRRCRVLFSFSLCAARSVSF